MEEIRSSFWGYNKEDVKNLITEKDKIINAQKKDIDFLRSLSNEQNSKNKQENTHAPQNSKRQKENLGEPAME